MPNHPRLRRAVSALSSSVLFLSTFSVMSLVAPAPALAAPDPTASCPKATTVANPAVFPIQAFSDPDANGGLPADWVPSSTGMWHYSPQIDTGWLRVTSAHNDEATAVYYNKPFPSDKGIVVDFDYAVWGGTGADGLSFFLFDGSSPSFNAGAAGGGLGYTQSTAIGKVGVPCAYVGVGLDEWGNWVYTGDGRPDGNTGAANGSQDNFGIRGPGNGMIGYNLVAPGSYKTSTAFQGNRNAGVHIRMYFTPVPSGTPEIKAEVMKNGQVIDQIGPFSMPFSPPPYLKLGFSGSTGGSNNIHELRNLVVAAPITLKTTVGSEQDGEIVAPGDPVTFTVTVANTGANDAPNARVDFEVGSGLTGVTWTCAPGTGAACGAGSGSGTVDTPNLPKGTSVTYTLTGTAAAAPSGPISLRATSSANGYTNLSNQATAFLRVYQANASNMSVTVSRNKSVTRAVAITDPEKVVTTGHVVQAPAHGSVTFDGLSFTYTPDTGYTGSDSFTYNADNGSGLGQTNTATVSVTVSANQAPTIAVETRTLPDVNEDDPDGETVVIADLLGESASDPEGQPVGVAITAADSANGTWQYGNGLTWWDFPAAPSVTESAALLLPHSYELRFIPSADWHGTASISYRAWDQYSGAVGGRAATTVNGGETAFSENLQSAAVTVNAVNDSPTFAGANVTVLEESGAYDQAWATGIAAGPEDEEAQGLSWAVSSDNDDLFAVQPAISEDGRLSFALAPNANGTATLTASLTDDDGLPDTINQTTIHTYTITVTPVNDAPSFTKGGDITVWADSGAYSRPWATGITAGPANEAGQELSFAVTNTKPELFDLQPAVGPDGTLTFRLASGRIGTATVTVTLNDNGGTANDGLSASDPQSFTIRAIRRPNDPPTITAISDVTTDEGKSATVSTSVADGDTAASNLVVSASSSNPSVATVSVGGSGGARTLTITPGAPGTATITVTVSDGEATATTSFTVTVNALPHPPEMPKLPPTTAKKGEPTTIPVTGTPKGGGKLVYTATGLPDGLTIDPETGVISGTPSGEPGVYHVTVTATTEDGKESTSTSFDLTVSAPEPAGEEETPDIGTGTNPGTQPGTVIINGTPVIALPKGGGQSVTPVLSKSGGSLQNLTQNDDGSYTATGVPAGSYVLTFQVTAPTGEKLVGPSMQVTVDANGDVKPDSELTDPRGFVMDRESGQPIPGVKMQLMWADTPLNRANGRVPHTPVTLPELPDFPPNQNHMPQWTSPEGEYAWMIYPNADYYIVATKDGYLPYDSRDEGRTIAVRPGEDSYVKDGIIHVGQSLVMYDMHVWLQEGSHKAYMRGYPDGSFRADRSVSRAEVATALARVLNLPLGAVTTSTFTDVPADHWALPYIEAAVKAGLLKGYPDATFRPENPVTRAEMAAIVARVRKLPAQAEPGSFSDIAGHWAAAVIGAVEAADVMNGYPDGSFRPEQFTSRAEFAAIVNKTVYRGPLLDQALTYTDLEASHWAYGEITEASSDHAFKRDATTVEHPNTP